MSDKRRLVDWLGSDNQREPVSRIKKVRGAADSRIIMIGVCKSNRHRPLRGLREVLCKGSWGFAALHPRLYANVRSAD
jgi:hypothetical protein